MKAVTLLIAAALLAGCANMPQQGNGRTVSVVFTDLSGHRITRPYTKNMASCKFDAALTMAGEGARYLRYIHCVDSATGEEIGYAPKWRGV